MGEKKQTKQLQWLWDYKKASIPNEKNDRNRTGVEEVNYVKLRITFGREISKKG